MSRASPRPLAPFPFLLCSHGRTAPTSMTMRMTMSTVPSTGDGPFREWPVESTLTAVAGCGLVNVALLRTQ